VSTAPATLEISADPVPLEKWDDGSIRVSGTRLLYYVFLGVYKNEDRPENLVDAFPFLSLGTVYRLVGYYHEHRMEIDEWLDAVQAAGEETRKLLEKHWPSGPTREELRRRWSERAESAD
jgi:uncharacterized protein (DUF433 family)